MIDGIGPNLQRKRLPYQLKDLAEIKPWLLSWGAAAEPLAPDELRAMVRDEAHKLLEILT